MPHLPYKFFIFEELDHRDWVTYRKYYFEWESGEDNTDQFGKYFDQHINH